ncbi:MAG: M24 family metallopeptidase [Betaproteobacteria bacterium]|nr:M24 family metallopeptidase [Betaproteobacteria bacterium]
MQTMHSTLLIGHYDWEPEHLPGQEFEARLAELWKRLPANVAAIAAFGDRRSNAELVYLTNFVPKLRDALAIIPRSGEPKLYVAGAGNMMPIAARQTWIKSAPTPLSEPAKAIAEWKAANNGSIAFVGGENLRTALLKPVEELVDAEATRQAGEGIRALMRNKRPQELQVIRQACAILRAMADALTAAHIAKRGVTAAVIEAEHIGSKMGAQEVRTLLSFDGGRTLRPFLVPVDKVVDPLQVFLSVRFNGYWAEGHVSLSKAANPAADKARAVLNSLIGVAKAGATTANLNKTVKEGLGASREHPVTAGSVGTGIGLALEEAPRLSISSGETLRAGDVCSLRAGVSEEAGHHAIVSAMVAVTASGNEVLWSS